MPRRRKQTSKSHEDAAQYRLAQAAALIKAVNGSKRRINSKGKIVPEPEDHEVETAEVLINNPPHEPERLEVFVKRSRQEGTRPRLVNQTPARRRK